MKRWNALAAAGLLLLAPMAYAAAGKPENANDEKARLVNAGLVMKEILDVPDDIPQDLLDKARCVVVMPSVLKAAFIFGGSYGRGAMICRTGPNFNGPWGAPAMYAWEGGSVGFQIGGAATDFVILVMNSRGADSLMGSKVKLGADATVAAGPKGRTAAADTDAYMRAEMLSYSRARGVFAGVSLGGSTLRPDGDANKKLYGANLGVAHIVAEPKSFAPAEAQTLIDELQKASPKLKP